MCFSDQSFGFAHFFDKTVQSNSVYLWFGWGKKKSVYHQAQTFFDIIAFCKFKVCVFMIIINILLQCYFDQ